MFLRLVLLVFFLNGCASVDYTEYRQTVLIKSDPPGAKVFEDGRQVGVTPGFVRVRRESKPKLTLQLPDEQSQEIELKTHYRWRGSFLPNLVFLSLAPVGWIADLSTGNAWTIEEEPTVEFPNPKGHHFEDRVQAIAVAPVAASAIDSSDTLGEVLSERLRQATDAQVMHYEVTAPIFEYHGFGDGYFNDRKSKNDLFYELGADHVFVSEASAGPQGFLVKGKLISVFTGRESMERSYEIVPKDGQTQSAYSHRQFFEKYFRFLPNTILANLSSDFGSVTVGETEYLATDPGGKGATDEVAKYVSAIGLSHIDRPRDNSRGHLEFEFVPAVALSQKRLRFELLPALSDTRFERWYLGAGYGPELGYRWRSNYVYMNLVPLWQWSRIDYFKDQTHGANELMGIGMAFEVGYSIFLSDHFVLRIYSRSLSEDMDLWRSSLSDAMSRPVELTSVSSSYSGLAFGYYFPSSLKRRESWRIRRR